MAVDGDRQRAGVCGETRGDGVVDEVGQHAAVIEVVHGGVRVVEGVGVSTVGIDVERAEAVLAGNVHPDVIRLACNRGNGLGAGAARVVVEDVAGRGVGSGGVFGDVVGVGVGLQLGRAMDCYRQRGGGRLRAVADRIVDRVR